MKLSIKSDIDSNTPLYFHPLCFKCVDCGKVLGSRYCVSGGRPRCDVCEKMDRARRRANAGNGIKQETKQETKAVERNAEEEKRKEEERMREAEKRREEERKRNEKQKEEESRRRDEARKQREQEEENRKKKEEVKNASSSSSSSEPYLLFSLSPCF